MPATPYGAVFSGEASLTVAAPALPTLTGQPQDIVCASGSVLECSEDLHHWTPVQTNAATHGIFTLDDPMDRPQRYFRVCLAP